MPSTIPEHPLHLGILCPEVSGHLNPMLALAKALQGRGHRLTLVGKLDGEDRAKSAGIDFVPVGETAYPKGSFTESLKTLGELSGRAALKFTIVSYRRMAEVLLDDAVERLRELQPDGLLIDQTLTPGSSIAELLDLPFVSLAGALPMNSEPGVPPPVTGWRYRNTGWGRLRNRAGHALFGWIAGSIRRTINAFRRRHALIPQTNISETFSRLAQIVQIPAEFDFPREELPACVHYVGPLQTPGSRPAVPFPFDKLADDKPLIYASMGTLQNRLRHVFRTIGEACADRHAQLVISQGGGEDPRDSRKPRGSAWGTCSGGTIAVDYAPQPELLQRASLTITHAGLNTAMESLAEGVPMVAIPVTNDQPGVAARIERSGCGLTVPLSKLSVPRLRTAVERVLTDRRFRGNARRLQQSIQQAGGVARAADVVETAIRTRRPVLPP
ncbi:MAG: glycosyltransferase [Planctomycetaceae bacterium]